MLLINYTKAPLPHGQSIWVIDGLKTGLFLFYDTLFTVVGALLAFLGLIVVIIVGLAVFRFAERNRPLSQT